MVIQLQSQHQHDLHSLIRGVASQPRIEEGESIVLDLQSWTRISSEALNELISLHTLAKTVGVRLVLANVASDLRKIFAITRLERMFDFE
jgi:anti-anti-sigma factor